MRVIHYTFLALAALILCVGAYMIMPVYFEYRQIKLTIVELERSLAEQRQQTLDLRQEIDGLRKDKEAIERVARERFGLCRDGEKIYHFDAPEGLGPTPPALGVRP